jgi:hypothetical protein
VLLCVLLAPLTASKDGDSVDLVALEEVSIVAALGCKEINLPTAHAAAAIICDNAAIVNKAAGIAGAWHGQPVQFGNVERASDFDALGIHSDASKWSQRPLRDTCTPRVLLVSNPEAWASAFASASRCHEPPIFELAATLECESSLEVLADFGDAFATFVEDGFLAFRGVLLGGYPVVGHVEFAHRFAECLNHWLDLFLFYDGWLCSEVHNFSWDFLHRDGSLIFNRSGVTCLATRDR